MTQENGIDLRLKSALSLPCPIASQALRFLLVTVHTVGNFYFIKL